MDENKYIIKPAGQVSTFNFKPNYNISFHNNSEGGTGKEVGKLDFNGPSLVFTGDAEESAKVFIDWIARSFAGRLEDERKAEREACAKVCEGYTDNSDADHESHGYACSAAIRERSANAGARGNT